MKADQIRVKHYLSDIKKNSRELQQLLDANQLKPDSMAMKAAKYILIELAEAMSALIQHILAKEQGVTVSGYIDSIVKAHSQGLISKELFQRLKPFFDFRNSLVHRYWNIQDQVLIQNMHTGREDFEHFIQEVENYISNTQK